MPGTRRWRRHSKPSLSATATPPPRGALDECTGSPAPNAIGKNEPPGKDGWREAFLDGLRQHGAVSHACKLAGVHRSTVYLHRDRDEAFATAWDEAEDEAIDGARARADSPLAKLWAEAYSPSVCDEIARVREAHKQEASALEPEDEPLTRDS